MMREYVMRRLPLGVRSTHLPSGVARSGEHRRPTSMRFVIRLASRQKQHRM